MENEAVTMTRAAFCFAQPCCVYIDMAMDKCRKVGQGTMQGYCKRLDQSVSESIKDGSHGDSENYSDSGYYFQLS